MHREFIETELFSKSWKAMDLTDDDMLRLQDQLIDNPDMGDVIQNTNGARKVRFALSNRGKSNSTRVIYVDIVVKQQIYFLLAYPKNRQDNLTESQKKEIRNLINLLKGE